MTVSLDHMQREVLRRLLRQYENSKTYRGKNRIAQTFSVKPSQVFAEYDSDFADLDAVRDFERQISKLESEKLISICWNNGQMLKLIANPEALDRYSALLGEKDKRSQQEEELRLYGRFLGIDESLNRFCKEQIERIENHKKAKYELRDAEKILELCKFLVQNQDDILERELSVAVLGDSKLWEKKYCSRVCKLLRNYGSVDEFLLGVDDEREVERILLEEYHVFSNPSYVHFKGNAVFHFADGQKLKINEDMPMAFSTETLKQLKSIEILDQNVMTIENLTSFNRIRMKDVFCIFLSGYHNSAKQRLICKIAEDNTSVRWFHFGDIDPDGFYIIEHLKRGTGIDFEPVYMDIEQLQKYEKYAKPLEANDMKKANALLQSGKYCDVMRYMLASGKKLEQEIISWMGGVLCDRSQ